MGMGVWVVGWMGRLMVGHQVGSCQITKNQLNLDLIEIVQFYFEIYDLWSVWIVVWMGGLIGKVVSNH